MSADDKLRSGDTVPPSLLGQNPAASDALGELSHALQPGEDPLWVKPGWADRSVEGEPRRTEPHLYPAGFEVSAETRGAEPSAEARGVERGVEAQGAEARAERGVEAQGAETRGAETRGTERGVEAQGAEARAERGVEAQGAETQSAEARAEAHEVHAARAAELHARRAPTSPAMAALSKQRLVTVRPRTANARPADFAADEFVDVAHTQRHQVASSPDDAGAAPSEPAPTEPAPSELPAYASPIAGERHSGRVLVFGLLMLLTLGAVAVVVMLVGPQRAADVAASELPGPSPTRGAAHPEPTATVAPSPKAAAQAEPAPVASSPAPSAGGSAADDSAPVDALPSHEAAAAPAAKPPSPASTAKPAAPAPTAKPAVPTANPQPGPAPKPKYEPLNTDLTL